MRNKELPPVGHSDTFDGVITPVALPEGGATVGYLYIPIIAVVVLLCALLVVKKLGNQMDWYKWTTRITMIVVAGLVLGLGYITARPFVTQDYKPAMTSMVMKQYKIPRTEIYWTNKYNWRVGETLQFYQGPVIRRCWFTPGEVLNDQEQKASVECKVVRYVGGDEK